MVWSVPGTQKGAGLNGRHGHLFDLVCAGLTTARALGDYIGSRPDSLNRTLKRLVDVGLMVKSGKTYVPADNVAALADRLALELGGVEACAHRENQYRNEARQWQETQERWEKEQESWKRLGGSWTDPSGRGLSSFDPFAIEATTDQAMVAASAEARSPWDEDYGNWLMEQLMLREVGLPNELP